MSIERVIKILHFSSTYTTTLKPLTCEENNIVYIITMAPVKGWDILGSNEQSVLKFYVLEAGKWAKI